jgi:opacity protein-like surface antigen
MNRSTQFITIAVSTVLGCSIFAQSVPPGNPNNLNLTAAQGDPWALRASVDYSYVAGGDITFQGVKGSSGAQSINGDISAQIPVNDKWFVPVGVGSRNTFLGTVADAPIPDQIDTLGFNAGVGYHLNEQWTFVGSIGPQLYRVYDVGGDDIGVGGAVRATWKFKPNLTFAFGFAFEPDSQAPVLPLTGIRWDIRTNLTLNLMWPRPALIYRVTDALDVFVGGGGNFAVFRADQNMGDKIGQPAFDNGLGTYRDFHIGAGVEYRLLRGLSASVEGGYSVGREIDYTRIDQTVSFSNSPYVRTALTYRF